MTTKTQIVLAEPMKPYVIALLERSAHKIDIRGSRGTGCIYVQLTHETEHTDEAWASINFTCEVDIVHEAGEYWVMDGFSYRALAPSSYVDDVFSIQWAVDEVDGCVWTPSQSDCRKIEAVIAEYVKNNAQIEPCDTYDHYVC